MLRAEDLIRTYESKLDLDSKPMGKMTLRDAIRLQIGVPGNPYLPGVNRDHRILAGGLEDRGMILYYESKYCAFITASRLARREGSLDDAKRFNKKAESALNAYLRCSWDATARALAA